MSERNRLSWIFLVAAICALLAVPEFVRHRYRLNPDGVSYLDIAANASAEHPVHLLNLYWSPLYPALLAAPLAILEPSSVNAVAVAQALNWLLFVGALAALGFLLLHWPMPRDALSFRSVTVFLYACFFWCAMELIDISNVTPDLLAAALLLMAAGLCGRLASPLGGPKTALALGATLALGYYARAALLPVSLMLLAILLPRPAAGLTRRKVALTAAAFLICCAPLVLALSLRAGKLTAGEAGRLNYGWFSTKELGYFIGWTGSPNDGHGTPVHPPRTLLETPRTLEFATPIQGTFPLWYDPAYWYEGSLLLFDWKQQSSALRRNLSALGEVLWSMRWIGLAILALAVASLAGGRGRFRLPHPWLLIWPVCAVVVYLPAALVPRHVGCFLFLFTVGFCGPLITRVRPAALATILLAASALLMALVLPGKLPLEAYRYHESQQPEILAARQLVALGLHPGDGVAVVGDAFWCGYVRHAGGRVVAVVLDKDAYWKLDDTEAAEVWEALRGAGARMLVTTEMPDAIRQSQWQQLVFNTWVRQLEPASPAY